MPNSTRGVLLSGKANRHACALALAVCRCSTNPQHTPHDAHTLPQTSQQGREWLPTVGMGLSYARCRHTLWQCCDTSGRTNAAAGAPDGNDVVAKEAKGPPRQPVASSVAVPANVDVAALSVRHKRILCSQLLIQGQQLAGDTHLCAGEGGWRHTHR